MNSQENETQIACCNGVGGLSLLQRLFGIGFAFLCFSLLFLCIWSLLKSYYRRFLSMSLALRSDVCSRVVSVIHSLIVVPLLIVGIAIMPWGEYFEPLGDVSFLQGILCISLGYFLYDTILLFIYLPPQWLVFASHHIVASIPYSIYMFANPCPFGLFILACFMLVEATNLPLHARSTLEENNMGNTKAYAAALYTTFFGWIIFRLINPTALVIIIHKYIIPSLPSGRLVCILPGVICAYLINFFCYGVFIFILCKEILLRWKHSPVLVDVAPLEATRPSDISVRNIPSDEQCILTENPTRLFVYEAQESIRERLERTGVIERFTRVRQKETDGDMSDLM